MEEGKDNRKSKMRWRKSQKLRAAKAICERYATNKYTIESCCDSEGVPYRTFASWTSEGKRGYVAEVAAIYKKALDTKADRNRGELKELALSAFRRLISGEEFEEKSTVVRVNPSGDGQITEVKKTTKRIMPNPAAVIFGLKNLDPEHFKDKQDIEVTDNTYIEALKSLKEQYENEDGEGDTK